MRIKTKSYAKKKGQITNYWVGRGHNFTTGRLCKIPPFVLTEATLQTPFLSGKISVIKPNGQCRGMTLSCIEITTVPTRTGLAGVFHFCLDCSVWRYSWRHRFQKDWTNWSISSYLEIRCNRVSLTSRDGRNTSGIVCRKWAGVSADGSDGSELCEYNGREFSNASIWVNTVLSSSKVRIWLPITFSRCVLTLFTSLSQHPPKWGALQGIFLRVMRCLASSVSQKGRYSLSKNW